jgi:hypothetical protein
MSDAWLTAQRLPFYCRWWFAPIIVVASASVGVAWFSALHALEPFDVFDFWFYLRLYCGLGVICGLGAWYFARLVATQRASLATIALIIAPAYLFVVFLGLDKNWSVAALATLAVAAMFVLMSLAKRSIRCRP